MMALIRNLKRRPKSVFASSVANVIFTYARSVTSKPQKDQPTIDEVLINSKEEADEILNDILKPTKMILTPQQIVQILDKAIIGQDKAKRIVANAIRDKYRRSMITGPIKDSIRPNNILIYGKTGTGKTEIFRQLAKACSFPFIRVEATKYSEVGYQGDDVVNIISDLYHKTLSENKAKVKAEIRKSSKLWSKIVDFEIQALHGIGAQKASEYAAARKELMENKLDSSLVTHNCLMKSYDAPKTATIRELTDELYKMQQDRLESFYTIEFATVRQIEENGIVVIDEIDKIVSDPSAVHNSVVSDKGVQNDLLPLLDGTVVPITHAPGRPKIDTRNILFVGCGAFETVKPTDLIPELQGRLPVQVKTEPLTKEDFVKILNKTEFNWIEKRRQMMLVDNVNLVVEEPAIWEIAQVAAEINQEEDIGARRLQTIIEAVLESVSFNAGSGQTMTDLLVTPAFVRENTKHLAKKVNYHKELL